MFSAILASRFTKPLIIVAVILGALGFAYYKGATDKQRQLELRALEAEVKAEKMRREIDNETENLGDYDLCIELGGLPEDCKQLMRGMGETSEAQ